MPHEALAFLRDATAGQIACYVAPDKTDPMRRLDSQGRQAHRILEVLLADRHRGPAAVKVQLLDL